MRWLVVALSICTTWGCAQKQAELNDRQAPSTQVETTGVLTTPWGLSIPIPTEQPQTPSEDVLVLVRSLRFTEAHAELVRRLNEGDAEAHFLTAHTLLFELKWASDRSATLLGGGAIPSSEQWALQQPTRYSVIEYGAGVYRLREDYDPQVPLPLLMRTHWIGARFAGLVQDELKRYLGDSHATNAAKARRWLETLEGAEGQARMMASMTEAPRELSPEGRFRAMEVTVILTLMEKGELTAE